MVVDLTWAQAEQIGSTGSGLVFVVLIILAVAV
jgi:Na+-transporting methylmalonyl-CoA/oxaloacetate decarboxylase gamma subunit